MPFDLSDCQFVGPALPEPFVRFELEKELTKLKLLAKTTGTDGKELKKQWEIYRRHLAQLAVRGGPVRVRNHAIEPIVDRLGYSELQQARVTNELRDQARKAIGRFIQEVLDHHRRTDVPAAATEARSRRAGRPGPKVQAGKADRGG